MLTTEVSHEPTIRGSRAPRPGGV